MQKVIEERTYSNKQTGNPDTNPDTETSKKTTNERRTEIYSEIYPENNPVTLQNQPTQKPTELSKFEKDIIEMFEIPENLQEIVTTDVPHLDLDLQTALNLPLEENSLLDLLIDSNNI